MSRLSRKRLSPDRDTAITLFIKPEDFRRFIGLPEETIKIEVSFTQTSVFRLAVQLDPSEKD